MGSINQNLIVEGENGQLELCYLDNKEYVYKSNNLIESAYGATIYEQRLLFMAIRCLKPLYLKSKIKPSEYNTLKGIKFGEVHIYTNEFKKEYDLKGNNVYERLSETASILNRRILMYFNSKDNYVERHWMSECEYDSNGRYVKIIFNPLLILDLLVFKSNFSKLSYDGLKKLNTSYAIRIYELCKSCIRPDRDFSERTISLKDLRFKLDISPESYPVFGVFKQQILNTSQKSINEHTDIDIEIELIRKGRKVDEIKFIITSKNEDKRVDMDKYTQEVVEVINSMLPITVSPSIAVRLADDILLAIKNLNIDMYPEEYVKEKIAILDEYSKNRNINDYVGLLRKAIVENWQPKMFVKSKEIGFSNYEQRNYNIVELEAQLLGY